MLRVRDAARNALDWAQYLTTPDRQTLFSLSGRENLEIDRVEQVGALLRGIEGAPDWFQYNTGEGLDYSDVDVFLMRRSRFAAAFSSGPLPLDRDYLDSIAARLNDALGGQYFKGFYGPSGKPLLLTIVQPTAFRSFRAGFARGRSQVQSIFSEFSSQLAVAEPASTS